MIGSVMFLKIGVNWIMTLGSTFLIFFFWKHCDQKFNFEIKNNQLILSIHLFTSSFDLNLHQCRKNWCQFYVQRTGIGRIVWFPKKKCFFSGLISFGPDCIQENRKNQKKSKLSNNKLIVGWHLIPLNIFLFPSSLEKMAPKKKYYWEK